MDELISVILPVYNVEKYIRQALDSVINQTYKNIEIILVDDGSPDNSGSICDEYALKDNRIKVIHKENGGVSSARNTGIEASTGDWIYFMDPDDWIELNTFELVMNKAGEIKTDMIFFDLYKRKKDQKKYCSALNHVNGQCFFNDMDNYNTWLTYNGASVCNCVIKSSVIINGNLKFDENLKIGEDQLFRMECYSHILSFAHIPKALYNYRDNSDSIMNNSNYKYKEYADLMYDKSCELAKNHKYTDFIQITANSLCISYLNRIIAGAFEYSYSKKEQKRIIFDYINSSNYQNSLKNCNACEINGMAKIIVRFKKPTMFKIRCVYILRNFKKLLERIIYSSK